MRVIKYFCDMCKREVPQRPIKHISFLSNQEYPGQEDDKFELCDKCYNKMLDDIRKMVSQDKEELSNKPKVAKSKKCVVCGAEFSPGSNRQTKCSKCKGVDVDIATTAKELADMREGV